MGTLATFLVACLFLSIYIPSNYGFSVGRSRRDADGTIEGLPSSWLTVGQVQEIKQTQESGQNFRDKYLEFFNKLDSEKKKVAGRQVVEKCYEWVKPVTSNEELLELSNLHHTDHGACKTKIKEYLGRVPDEQKEKIEKNLQICDDIWYKSHIEISAKVQNRHGSGQGHHGKRVRRDEDHSHVDHHGSHKLEDYFKNHLSWLTDTQKDELKTLKAEGKSRKELQDKVFEYYEGTTGETKEKATELLRGGCKELLTTVIGPEKTAQLKQLKESGTAKEEIEKKVKEFIGEVTDPHKKQIAEEYEAPCKRVYGVGSRKKREHKVEEAKLEEALKTHLSWLTDDQKAEVKTLTSEGKSFEDVQKKVFEYYGALSGEAKDKATQLLQEGCRSLIKELVGEEKANELKKLRESGASKAELKNKIVALMDELTDPEKKEKAVKFAGGCQKVFEVDSARVKREHKVEEAKLEEALKTHLSWLTDDQKAEVKTLTSEGKSFEDVQKKVFEYYGALSGEAKDKATQLLQEGCRSLIKELVGEEKANELKTLRESGASKADLKNKIVALMDELTDPEKKEKAVKFAGGCQKVFEIESARMKRDTKIDDAKFEEALTTHLSWLTDDQKEQLKTLKSEGKSFEDVQKKVFEFYGALSGDSKTKATELLQEGCRSVIKDLVGEEKANELKKLRESGASKTELKEKIVKLMDELTDPEKKEKALKFAGGCQKVFEIESRKKRDVDADKLQQALNTHLSWLTDEQKSTLKTLQSEGKSFTDLNDKVFEWYGQLSGEAQQKAKELLQGGCRALIKELAGDEKAEELKKLRESGASKEEIKNKVVSFLDALTDEDKKKKALKYAPACQKIFDLDSARVKRDEGQGKLEEAFKTHLSWLTEDQKQELRSLKNEGKEFSDMQTKVFGWYEALSGEEKEKATELLKGGCRHLMTEILGEEKAGELKKLKESGTSKDDLKTKVSEFINALTDEEKKAKAKQYAGACEKIFGVSSRKKRDDHDHHGHDHHIDHEKRHAKLEEYFKTHLSWLTDAQKQTLKDLCMQDKTDQELQAKVFEFYEALTGEAKEKATQLLQDGCRSLIKSVLGDEKAAELKKLKESGATKEAIETKIQELIAGLEDGEKKKKAQEYGPVCKKIFGVSRKKRSSVDAEAFEKNLQTSLSWLTDAQKDQLRNLKNEGKSFEDLEKKTFEFYGELSGEAKQKAAELMKDGCRALIKDIVGEEKANEIKKLKESGASKKDIKSKVVEFMDEVTDPAKKEKATKYAGSCMRIFELEEPARVKREHKVEEAKLEEALKTHLSWLTDDQKAEVKTLTSEGKSFEDVQKKVFEYYGALNGEAKDKATQLLQEGCRSLIKELVGEEKANELKTLRESGASKTEIKNKVVALMDELTDPEKKEKAVKFAGGCQKVFEIESARVKREHKVEEAKLEEALKTHLSWLTDDQKAEVKTLTSEGKSFEDVQKKVFEYYGALSGEAKDKATQLLQEGCRSLIKELVGEEKANELKTLRESGASKTELKNKIVALMDELTDPEKKEKAVKFAGGCQKVFEIESARVKREHKVEEAKLEEALKTHLSWLTDDQKAELKTLTSEGKSFEDVQKKVFEYYGALSGEAKDKATQLLQEGCRSLIKELVGEEKANELKTLRESGASKTEIKNKVVALMDELTDPVKKEKAVKFASGCQKVFEIESARVKREHKIEDAKFEEALTTHLSWLTDDQKEQLKTLKSEGKSFEDVQKKVFEFYGALSGDSKTKATELLQEGCRSVIKDLVGEEKANELKKLRESGASKTELKEKIVKLMDELTDPEKKEKALKFAGGCQKVFEIESRKKRDADADKLRKKRDHHVEADKLQEALNTHLSWLTDEQKATLKTLQSEGKSFTDLNDKVFEWYGQLSGEAQQKAKELLQGGCRALIKELAGDEKAEELKKLRESGASKEEIKNKVVSFLDALTDEDKKKKALKYAPACQKIFDLGKI